MAPAIRDHFVQRCKNAVQSARAIPQAHPVVVGTIRELLVKQMLVPMLPPEVRSGTGQLTNKDGVLSPQIDVILYAPQILPPALYDDVNGFFPIEAALYTIEVKSTLTKAGITSSVQSARAIKKIPSLPAVTTTFDQAGLPRNVTKPMATSVQASFAFASDLKGDPSLELKRYLAAEKEADSGKPALQAFCVVGRGYWTLAHYGWKYVKASDDLNEVMAFLSGVTNTLSQILQFKGRPQFGYYLSDDITMENVIPSV